MINNNIKYTDDRRSIVAYYLLAELGIKVFGTLQYGRLQRGIGNILTMYQIIVNSELTNTQWRIRQYTFQDHYRLLNELFQLSLKEENKTNCKQNRYTKSTLFYISSIIKDIQYVDSRHVNDVDYCARPTYEDCSSLLNDILNISIVHGFLELNSDELKKDIISVIINDLFQNNTCRLQLFLSFNNSLFDIGYVVDEMLNDGSFSLHVMSTLFKFIIDHKLGNIHNIDELLTIVKAKIKNLTIFSGNDRESKIIRLIQRYFRWSLTYSDDENVSTIDQNPLTKRSKCKELKDLNFKVSISKDFRDFEHVSVNNVVQRNPKNPKCCCIL